jgi:hypothetical protein
MIVDDLHVLGASDRPPKTEPPLIVDADAVLTPLVTRQGLKPIPWRRSQEIERRRRLELGQFTRRHLEDRPEAPRLPGFEELAGVVALEAPNHRGSLYRITLNVKRRDMGCKGSPTTAGSLQEDGRWNDLG